MIPPPTFNRILQANPKLNRVAALSFVVVTLIGFCFIILYFLVEMIRFFN